MLETWENGLLKFKNTYKPAPLKFTHRILFVQTTERLMPGSEQSIFSVVPLLVFDITTTIWDVCQETVTVHNSPCDLKRYFLGVVFFCFVFLTKEIVKPAVSLCFVQQEK